MRLRCKIWLEDDHRRKAFGDGPLDLLQRVQRLGSLRRAAAEIRMSYSQAWHLVSRLEDALGFPLLSRHSGGSKGGGSRLTTQAQELMARYGSFRMEAGELLDELYATHLSSFPWSRA